MRYFNPSQNSIFHKLCGITLHSKRYRSKRVIHLYNIDVEYKRAFSKNNENRTTRVYYKQ